MLGTETAAAVLGTEAAVPLGNLVEPETPHILALGPDMLLRVPLLMGHLGIHGLEIDGAAVTGEHLLLGML